MTYIGLAALLTLLCLLIVREIRQVYAPTAERRRQPLMTYAELVMWGACAVLVLPRLVELLT
ncbi:hypothetical protein EV643_12825 [Kribbella sp. VKM Ac-2527]|uniref:Uncharacterized protein n=1 Tax=Kribbella caucasensis TaxID=2512215 RepID=A0A4R6JEB2_9ACTN|nr:hypothetical protein [Kribbella sp. VKM Ac-2527]TDO34240.1 hypothetical protein EV643_12825 [Kribbella sp. VKM Ac-2527]